jgi:hypothetical protein
MGRIQFAFTYKTHGVSVSSATVISWSLFPPTLSPEMCFDSATSKVEEQKLHLRFKFKTTLPSTCYGIELLVFQASQQQ